MNPKLRLNLPAEGLNHSGGKLVLGKDHSLYTVTCDLNRKGQSQNFKQGSPQNNTSVILMVNPMTGMVYGDNPFNSTSDPAMKAYYVYGIGNSFGLAKNQITSKLWDTENGDMDYDEINMLYPGFNGGWKKINGSLS